MRILKSKDELHEHRALAIQKLDDYLFSLIESDESIMKGKADKLSYCYHPVDLYEAPY